MEIFGIGPLELLLIVIIMLVVLGPKEMVATAGKIGRFVRQVVRSPMWGTIMQTSKDVRDFPTKIIREAGLEEDIAQIKEVARTPAQMMNEAAKQLKVEIDPIEFPKIPNPLSSSSPSSTPTITPFSPSSTSLLASTAVPTPLEIDPIVPLTIETPATTSYPANDVTPTPLQVDFNDALHSPLPEETETPQVFVPPTFLEDQAVEGSAAPLMIDSSEPLTDLHPSPEVILTPKRRPRRSKSDSLSSTQDQSTTATGASTDQVLRTPPPPGDSIEKTSQLVRKPKRSRVKPIPPQTETLVVVETTSPHENGGSAKG